MARLNHRSRLNQLCHLRLPGVQLFPTFRMHFGYFLFGLVVASSSSSGDDDLLLPKAFEANGIKETDFSATGHRHYTPIEEEDGFVGYMFPCAIM